MQSEKYIWFLQIMRQRRIDRGALTLASPEVKFEIDTETHDPLDVGESILVPDIHLSCLNIVHRDVQVQYRILTNVSYKC